MKRHIADPDAMEALGAGLGNALEPGLVIFLRGELGAGKTTLVRGLLRALGYTGAVKSPTYTLVESYPSARVPIYHFDFYRLSDPRELAFIGIRDYFTSDAVCLAEWPERAGEGLSRPDLTACIHYCDPGREVTWASSSPMGERVARRLNSRGIL